MDTLEPLTSDHTEHGRMYWLVHNLAGGFWRLARRYPRISTVFVIVLLFALYSWHYLLQSFAVMLRIHFGTALMIALVAGVIYGSIWFFGRGHSRRLQSGFMLLGTILVIGLAVFGDSVITYLSLHQRYATLNLVELKELPTTDHERVLPLNVVWSLANERISETESPTPPDLVRIGEGYFWAMAIEPSYLVPRVMDKVDEIIQISATTVAPDFSRRQPIAVSFTVSENMLLSKKTSNCSARAFGFWRYFSYESSNILYMKDDVGAWVQVVTLIRWSGLFFPRPEFGGGQIIRQEEDSLSSWWRHITIGCGEWIPPEHVPRHVFLQGQNILSYDASRYMAESFRFQNGLFAPMPWNHRGDIRIPNLPDDVNHQPFTLFFKNEAEGMKGKLYHYFGLEPYDQEKQGLSVSVFVPADGIGPSFVYRHSARGDNFIGISAVGPKVEESRKQYDWTKNRPVEHRPFIRKMRDANGVWRTRFTWLTTIVTFKNQEEQQRTLDGTSPRKRGPYTAGAIPEIVITDAANGKPVWVTSADQEVWVPEVERELGKIWAQR
ncbi:MAG: hypothetical protein A2849_02355 [Candidatus Taylorbacteria bacterium RIFCSPHIGHO2_01_FULL_51_15]|uniref:Uncharacterized protein n=1 Tax=Candidatus Taylorbacteria bacterium RIFCSPHIGHO2_01_FULL_51_15 TaxID=1802304 RepID=A0A1G2MF12_9BACT|nr:MAG: hypothetical protein A2849_02355 [Candidatus Taylorbacteria bacterium RIFCSPHIGHO2_01_FULL_51_15]